MGDVKGQVDGAEWGGCNQVYSVCFLGCYTYIRTYIHYTHTHMHTHSIIFTRDAHFTYPVMH